MNPCKLITYFCQYSVIRLDTENGDAVCKGGKTKRVNMWSV